jgi:hypothetical protein
LALLTALQIYPRRVKKTLFICRIDLQKNQELEKQYPWKRPNICPCCKGCRLWGHGFVLRYFVGFATGLWMKRWRCPDCGAVHTARPEEYCPGVQYPRSLQQKSLTAKLSGKPFLSTLPRQVQQHWLKTFRFICRQTANWDNPLAVLRDLLRVGQFHLTKRRIYSARWLHIAAPYLSFALTTKPLHFSLE